MYNPPGSTLYESPLMLQLIEALPSLKPALRKVAEFILRDPLQAATMNIHELGVGTGSSTAAVHRFAKALGFDGFIGLRGAMLANLRGWLSPVAARQEPYEQGDGHFSLEQQVRQAKSNLDSVVDSNPKAAFDAMVQALGNARRVYIVGFGNSFHLAGLFGAMLIPYSDNITVLSTDGGIDITAQRIASIRADDALFALSLPPYTRETVNLARYAKSNGATLLALTDSPTSPLASLSDHALYASPHHPVLRHSTGALLNLIEGLVAAIQLRHQPRIEQALDQARRAQTYMHGEDLPAMQPAEPANLPSVQT
jgi:DNA-binding MurR/RpiR family transcriptional regulator